MGVLGWLDAEGTEQGQMLGGVAQVVLAADDMGDVHLQIVHHINQMKHRLPVRAHNDEIRVQLFTVG